MKDPHAVPQILLERYVLGEASPAQKEQIEKHLLEEGAGGPLHERLMAIRQSNAEHVEHYPPRTWVPRILQRVQPARTVNRGIVYALSGLAAACLVIVFLPSRSLERLKGLGPSLQIYRQNGDSPELLGNGAVVSPGDRLQLIYHSAGAPYGAIFSIDGLGKISKHLSGDNGKSSTSLDTTSEKPLAEAFQLDDSPDFERFVFVTSNRPFSFEEAIAVYHKEKPAPVLSFEKAGLRFTLMILKKPARP